MATSKNRQGGLADVRIDRPDIVKKLDERDELMEDLAEGMKELRTVNKEVRDLIGGLGVEVPEGGEVRVAIVGEGAAYSTVLKNKLPESIEFERKGGIKIGRIKRDE